MDAIAGMGEDVVPFHPPHRISRRRLLGGAAATGLIGCSAGRSEASSVVLILLDQLRASALSTLGQNNIATPVLDALAGQSALFTNALCSDPRCTPSRASLLTGLYPTATGVIAPEVQLTPLFRTYSEQFRDAGYACAHVGKWHVDGSGDHVPPGLRRRGFDAGWAGFNKNGHRYTESTYYRDTAQPLHPEPADTYEPVYQTAHALDFVDQLAPDPFLLVLSYQPPHPPAELTSNLGPWDGWIPAQWMEQVDRAAIQLDPSVPAGWTDPAREFLHGYYAALLSMDALIGDLLQGLDARGLGEDTLLVLLSDHGELAGAHGLFGKEHPYDPGMRVPWMLRWPGRIAPQRISTPVSGVDLAPTLLGLAGLPLLPTGHGRDLSRWLLAGQSPPPQPILVQGQLDAEPWAALREDQLLLSARPGGEAMHLHDLSTDPHQLVDLVEDPASAGTRDRLHRLLDQAWEGAR